MPRLFVLDASVFVNACHGSEPGAEIIGEQSAAGYRP
jgi:hypothetical protein